MQLIRNLKNTPLNRENYTLPPVPLWVTQYGRRGGLQIADTRKDPPRGRVFILPKEAELKQQRSCFWTLRTGSCSVLRLVEVRRIELRSTIILRKVSPSSVDVRIGNRQAHRQASAASRRFDLSPGHTDYVPGSNLLKMIPCRCQRFSIWLGGLNLN